MGSTGSRTQLLWTCPWKPHGWPARSERCATGPFGGPRTSSPTGSSTRRSTQRSPEHRIAAVKEVRRRQIDAYVRLDRHSEIVRRALLPVGAGDLHCPPYGRKPHRNRVAVQVWGGA